MTDAQRIASLQAGQPTGQVIPGVFSSDFNASPGATHVWDGAVALVATLPFGAAGQRVAFMSDNDGPGGFLTILPSGGQAIEYPASAATAVTFLSTPATVRPAERVRVRFPVPAERVPGPFSATGMI